MGAVGIEETASVGAQHFDGFLRSNWALRDGLISYGVHDRLAIRANGWLSVRPYMRDLLRLNQLHRVVRPQILDNSLRNQHQGVDNTHGNQDPKSGAG